MFVLLCLHSISSLLCASFFEVEVVEEEVVEEVEEVVEEEVVEEEVEEVEEHEEEVFSIYLNYFY